MNRTGLFNLSWERYLNLLFLLLTVGFLSSGVVTFIAANWDYLSDLAKIYGLQTLFVFSVIIGGYFFMRESLLFGRCAKFHGCFCCLMLLPPYC